MFQRTLHVWLLCSALIVRLTAQSHHVYADPRLKPFYHGVASGQPSPDGFVIWTRLAPDQINTPGLQYFVAETPDFQTIVRTGIVTAQADRDYTARVRIQGLQPDRYYYYYFRHPEGASLVGRAKTLPVQTDHVRLVIVSCSRYESGHFNAYGAIAQRNDLDAVVHLGDYIYEYEANTTATGFPIEPKTELLTLADYRSRYSSYRLDSNLIRLHQQHTFISVWDDHEAANNAHTNGAANHNPGEGDWQVRKQISKRVYHEWLPIATPETIPIYGGYRFGGLADLLMLDTRLDGRDPQPLNFDDPNPRQLISQAQFAWLTTSLKDPHTRWKILGNQILFSDLNSGFVASNPQDINAIRAVDNRTNDMWRSYSHQRDAIIDTIARYQIPGVVIATGDSHASWVFDVAKQPVLYPLQQFNYLPQPNPYDPATGQGYDVSSRAGTRAVEFCTPSITSPNGDEQIGTLQAALLEALYLQTPQPPNPAYNPHLRYCDLDRHGYFLLNIRPDTVQADYFYAKTILSADLTEQFGTAYVSHRTKPGAFARSTPSANKPFQALPTPTLPFGYVSTEAIPPTVLVGTVFPNPTSDALYVHLIAREAGEARISVTRTDGQIVIQPLKVLLSPGSNHHVLRLDALPAGMYMIHVRADRTHTQVQVVKG